MKIDLSIVRGDSEVTVITRPGDLVAWEKNTGKSISDWVDNTPAFTDIAWLAWRAETRGKTVTFEDWIEEVDDIGIAVGDTNPTNAGP